MKPISDKYSLLMQGIKFESFIKFIDKVYFILSTTMDQTWTRNRPTLPSSDYFRSGSGPLLYNYRAGGYGMVSCMRTRHM